MTVPFSSNPARSHASITGAYAAIVCFPGAARGGGAGGEAGPSASRYFLTVRQLSPVSRAISEMLTSACRSALNRRSSSHRSASSTNPQPPPREDQPIKATGSQLSRCVTSRRAARLCTFARTWLCTLARTPTPPAKGGACADPEASWGHRRNNLPGIRAELFFGYYLQAAIMMPEEGGPPVPE